MPEQTADQSKKIWTKTPCRHFGGRAEELATLQAAVHELPKPIGLISGAPGAGKTSLLQEFVRRVENDVAVLEVLPADLGNAENLVSALLEEANHHRQLRKRVTEVAARTVAGVFDKALASIIAAETGVTVELPVVQSAAESYLAQEEKRAKSIGLLLGESFPNGYVIIVDEAQELVQHQSSTFTRTFLHAMQNSAGRGPRGRYGRGWLLLCGLNDTQNVVANFGLTRPEIIANVGAIERTAAAEVLFQHLQDAGCSQSVEQRIVREWIPKLADEFHVWGHHLEGAGRSLARIAKEEINWHHGLQQVQTAARAHQEQLYAQLHARAADKGVSDLVLVVARYARMQENLISEEALLEIIAFVQPPVDKLALGRVRVGHEVQRTLLHIGVLQAYDTLPDGTKGRWHLRVPIPSLLDYLNSGWEIGQDAERKLREIQATVDRAITAVLAAGKTDSTT